MVSGIADRTEPIAVPTLETTRNMALYDTRFSPCEIWAMMGPRAAAAPRSAVDTTAMVIPRQMKLSVTT